MPIPFYWQFPRTIPGHHVESPQRTSHLIIQYAQEDMLKQEATQQVSIYLLIILSYNQMSILLSKIPWTVSKLYHNTYF